jgi:CSLREA domain-containing protein
MSQFVAVPCLDLSWGRIGWRLIRALGSWVQRGVEMGDRGMGREGTERRRGASTGLSRSLRLASVWLVLLASTGAHAALDVNTFLDAPDAFPGNGVCETATGNKTCSLRAAVQELNAQGGGTINLQPGVTYTLTRMGSDEAALTGDLDITGNITIVGAGPGSTIIDGNGASINEPIFDVKECHYEGLCGDLPPVYFSISGVTMRNGHGSSGGAILNRGHLMVTNCVLENNAAAVGGAIYSTGIAVVSASTITGNTASVTGGGLAGVTSGPSGPTLEFEVTDSTISGNVAVGDGGGAFLSARSRFVNSTVSGNISHADGGGAYLNTPASLVNSTVSGNFSYNDGGGIYATGADTTALYHSTVTLNQANADESGTAVAGGHTTHPRGLSIWSTASSR